MIYIPPTPLGTHRGVSSPRDDDDDDQDDGGKMASQRKIESQSDIIEEHTGQAVKGGITNRQGTFYTLTGRGPVQNSAYGDEDARSLRDKLGARWARMFPGGVIVED